MPLNVIVTGAGGILGRSLVPLLQKRGHQVIAADRRLSMITASIATIQGDLADATTRTSIIAALRDCGDEMSAIIHLAARSDVSVGSASRDTAFAANVLLTQLMLEAAVAANITRFVFASSGHVYGVTGSAPVVENQVARPRSMYAATKLAAEALVQGYAAECRIAGTILRISNVFGPDSPDSTVAGRILSQLRQRRSVDVASRLPVRDFIFVDDVAEAICALIEAPEAVVTDVFNVSTGIGTGVGALADTATAIANGKAWRIAAPDSANQDCLILSNERIRRLTGWAPRHSLVEGLKLCLTPQ